MSHRKSAGFHFLAGNIIMEKELDSSLVLVLKVSVGEAYQALGLTNIVVQFIC